jgi:hypothetical protein
MKTEDQDQKLRNMVCKSLDESIVNLDRQTLLRLQGIRMRALEDSCKRKDLFSARRWITAGGLATVAVLVLAISLWVVVHRQPLPAKHGEDAEILSAQEHLELYEDLEFYRWLATEKAD